MEIVEKLKEAGVTLKKIGDLLFIELISDPCSYPQALIADLIL